MDRSSFIDSKKERKVNFLRYHFLIERLYADENDLPVAYLRHLFYLDDVGLFSRNDFKGTLLMRWCPNEFNKLLKEGWINPVNTTYKKAGVRYRYKVSPKGKRLINTIYKILCGEEELPERFLTKESRERSRKVNAKRKKAAKSIKEKEAEEQRNNFFNE